MDSPPADVVPDDAPPATDTSAAEAVEQPNNNNATENDDEVAAAIFEYDAEADDDDDDMQELAVEIDETGAKLLNSIRQMNSAEVRRLYPLRLLNRRPSLLTITTTQSHTHIPSADD
jgi:hypothetical protein